MKFCSYCASPFERGNSDVCHKHSVLRWLQSLYLSGRRRAGAIVGVAVRRGWIPSARSQRCADCGAAAVEYDHRDYNFPLKVEPVCRRCNLRRGTATWYRWPSFEDFQKRHGNDLHGMEFEIYYAVIPRAKSALTIARRYAERAA